MFHVKPKYLILRPRLRSTYILDKRAVFSEKVSEMEEKNHALESLDITGFSSIKTLKNPFLRSFSMKWKLFASLLLLNTICFGQLEPVAIGEWKIHMPTKNAKDVTKAGNKYYAAFTNGIQIYDNEDGSLELLSKTNGLSSIGVSQVEFDPISGNVIVGYLDGNLDLISSEGEIYNMSDIKRSNILGDKTIYNIVGINNLIYLCTGFGIVVLDATSKEIKDTYIFGPGGTNIKVNSVCSDGTKLFAATDEGLFSGLLSNPFLSNFTSWTKDLTLNPAAENGPFSHIAYHAGSLFISRTINGNNNDSAYVFNGSWSYFTPAFGNEVNKLKSIGDKLLYIGSGSVALFNQAMVMSSDMFGYTFDYIDGSDADYSAAENQFYIADRRNGLTRGVNTWSNEKISQDSPYTLGCAHIAAQDGTVLIAHDGFAGVNGLNTFSKAMFSGSIDNKWLNFNELTEPLMNSDSIFDAVSVCIDPKDKNHWYFGTYSYKGLFEILDGEIVNVFDESNSAIGNAGITGYNAISSMDFDEDGNLWMINSKSAVPLIVKKKDNTWTSIDIGTTMKNRNIYDLEVGKSGYIWVAAPTGNNIGGLLVYNTNETIDDISDDVSYFYSTGSGFGNLPSQDVKCVLEDLDEEIWVGTADGLAVIYNQDAAFTGSNFDAQQILIEQDGNVQVLMEDEVITDIEVDGANRKWIATEGSGVFLLSEDGQEEILRLTKENSPLLSNIVYDIAIDQYNGDIYFATSDGVSSLRYTATGSMDAYQSVFAFPNPVNSDYDGIVAVKGLSKDSDFKVTDLTGNIVFHGISLGGQAIWDLKDISGNRVSTGVYLIYCNSESGAKDAVAKLLVIN
jgi:hypothetical protein